MPREVLDQTVYDDFEAKITAVEEDPTLYEVAHFVAREQARRLLQEQIITRIDQLIDRSDKGQKKRLRVLKRHALAVRGLLLQAHEQLWVDVRQQIRVGECSSGPFLELLAGYRERARREVWNDPPRYDSLDVFIDGLLQIAELPRAQSQPDPEMVLYQPTPVRIVLELLERLQLTRDDVFYDLGSGLGRVTLIAGLVSEAQVRGVEYEPAYCEYGQRRARDLNLDRAKFIHADARDVDYSDGTVFYLYTPFKGKILQRVLDLLRYEAQHRRIRVCTYGPGTLDVLPEEWLVSIDRRTPDVHWGHIYEGRTTT